MGKAAIIVVILYILTFLYSIYHIYLNWKQSKVLNEIQTSNKILIKVLEALHNIRNGKET